MSDRSEYDQGWLQGYNEAMVDALTAISNIKSIGRTLNAPEKTDKIIDLVSENVRSTLSSNYSRKARS